MVLRSVLRVIFRCQPRLFYNIILYHILPGVHVNQRHPVNADSF